MKLLFDQNISFRIVNRIQSFFPNSKQIKELKLEDSSDMEIWDFAKSNEFTIVTFDADFADIANLKGCPPKIIWLRTGNITTNTIIEILVEHQKIIVDFTENPQLKNIACLEIE